MKCLSTVDDWMICMMANKRRYSIGKIQHPFIFFPAGRNFDFVFAKDVRLGNVRVSVSPLAVFGPFSSETPDDDKGLK